MKAGEAVDLRVEWTPRLTMTVMDLGILGTTLGPVVKLGWEGPNRLIADAAEQARKAEVAVVVVGHRVGEGMSRESLDLPGADRRPRQHETAHAWRMPPGEYRIAIGTSSRGIIAERSVVIDAGASSCSAPAPHGPYPCALLSCLDRHVGDDRKPSARRKTAGTSLGP